MQLAPLSDKTFNNEIKWVSRNAADESRHFTINQLMELLMEAARQCQTKIRGAKKPNKPNKYLDSLRSLLVYSLYPLNWPSVHFTRSS